jgi:subtilisin family serine protease
MRVRIIPLAFSLLGVLLLESASLKGETVHFNLNRDHIANELVITVNRSLTGPSLTRLKQRYGFEIVHKFRSSSSYLIRFHDNLAPQDLYQKAKDLKANGNVANVESNAIYRLFGNDPNDSDFSKQWSLENTGQNNGTAGADIRIRDAWQIARGSSRTLVAVIDTGVDYTHPDIAPNYYHNPGETGTDEAGRDKSSNGVDDDRNGFIDDFRGWDFINNDNDPLDDHNHGTHCAGVIGAKANNATGIAGINWNVSLMGLKVFDAGGSTDLATLTKAVEYATQMKVKLTSNSWGGGSASPLLEGAIREADKSGILFIAAAGNSSQNVDKYPNYPSGYPVDNIIAVAASDRNDTLASYSNYGKYSVDLAAPGSNIYSTITGGGYLEMSGTSMATPHVAGVAALVWSAYPELTHYQVKQRLLGSADPLSAFTSRTLTGGRLNAAKSLERDDTAPSTPGHVTVDTAGAQTLQISFNASGDDAMEGQASSYAIRISSEPITNEEQWNKAQAAKFSIKRSTENPLRLMATLSQLAFNSSGYLAIRAVDNVGLASGISSSLEYRTRPVSIIYHNKAQDLADAVASDKWGIETVGGSTMFSDSPAGAYQNSSVNTLTLKPININSEEVSLLFQTQYDLEDKYDYGSIELSTDGGVTWKLVTEYTGMSPLKQEQLDLSSFVRGAQQIQLRFSMTTDNSVTRDGWKIGDIMVLSGS